MSSWSVLHVLPSITAVETSLFLWSNEIRLKLTINSQLKVHIILIQVLAKKIIE